MLVGMWERCIKPTLIITADVGNERPETYAFRPVFDDWLESVSFPRSVTVRYQPGDYKHWPPYNDLLSNCLTKRNASLFGLWLPYLFGQMEDRADQQIRCQPVLGTGMVGRRRKDPQGHWL